MAILRITVLVLALQITHSSACRDFNSGCGSWASSGECTNNPEWMKVNCRSSCKKCPNSSCSNKYDEGQCDGWAENNECFMNPGWMNPNCAKSCNACPGAGSGSGNDGGGDGNGGGNGGGSGGGSGGDVSNEISAKTKQFILDEHNKFRSKVNPTASNMMKMYWSNDIARHAQQYANSCPDGHDTAQDRKDGAGLGIGVGQNLAWGYATWEVAIDGWHSEVKDFQMGVGSYNGGVVGHYTQLVRDHATHIGCGFKNCQGKRMPTHFVCNYAYAQMDFKTPYHSGASCGECRGKCKNKLCDCGDVICKNGGNMDPASCTCKCKNPFVGAQCETAQCGADPKQCGSSWGFQQHHCDMWTNVPEECPKMCGIC